MFCIICTDKPDSLELRMATRDAHIAYVVAAGAAGEVAFGGPFVDDDGAMVGTLVVLNVESRAEAEAWTANDPYQKAGLFEKTEVHGWQHLLGGLPPLGGH